MYEGRSSMGLDRETEGLVDRQPGGCRRCSACSLAAMMGAVTPHTAVFRVKILGTAKALLWRKKNYNGPRKKVRIPVVRCEPGLHTPATSKTTVLQVLLATDAQKAISTRLFVKQHTALQLIGDGETKAKHIGKQFPQHFFAE